MIVEVIITFGEWLHMVFIAALCISGIWLMVWDRDENDETNDD